MKKKVKKLSVTKRIKADEKQIVLGIAFVIVVLILLVVCFVFSALNGENIPGIKSGPLYIEFSDNEDGMSDIVNFTEENIPDDEDGYTIYSTSFKVTNTKSGSSWYAIYLDDYVDAIKLDECQNNLYDKEEIYFSIDNLEPISLASVNYGGRYVISEGIIDSNNDVTHTVKVWYKSDEKKHYHGKISVECLR